MERWCINIDIEGFSLLWEKEDQILWALGELMRAIFRIGRACFPDSPDRLFAHQIGDGFFIISDFHEQNLERCVSIAVAIMKHVVAYGRLMKGAIAEGELSDIQNCYPREVLARLEADHTVSLKMGLMTIFPVMGTALIRSFKLAEKSPSGPLLVLDKSKQGRLPSNIPFAEIDNTDLISIDWVHMNSDFLSKIQGCARLKSPSAVEIEKILRQYCKKNSLKNEWVSNVNKYLGIKIGNDNT